MFSAGLNALLRVDGPIVPRAIDSSKCVTEVLTPQEVSTAPFERYHCKCPSVATIPEAPLDIDI